VGRLWAECGHERAKRSSMPTPPTEMRAVISTLAVCLRRYLKGFPLRVVGYLGGGCCGDTVRAHGEGRLRARGSRGGAAASSGQAVRAKE
jgi:hypothetical protein